MSGTPPGIRVEYLPQSLANHLGCEQEMVIMTNDEITRLIDLGNTLSKHLVGLVIGEPRRVRRGDGSSGIEP